MLPGSTSERGSWRRPVAGMDCAQVQAEMPEVWALAGAGQGFETFAAAVSARNEIEAAIRKLTRGHGPDVLSRVTCGRSTCQRNARRWHLGQPIRSARLTHGLRPSVVTAVHAECTPKGVR